MDLAIAIGNGFLGLSRLLLQAIPLLLEFCNLLVLGRADLFSLLLKTLNNLLKFYDLAILFSNCLLRFATLLLKGFDGLLKFCDLAIPVGDRPLICFLRLQLLLEMVDLMV